jgi:hypothetical protein
MEGHAGSLGYYLELLPRADAAWTALLVPFVARVAALHEPLGLPVLWFRLRLVFSRFRHEAAHYVLYGFTPLVLLVGQELVNVRRGVRIALCVTMLRSWPRAASPWIAHESHSARTTRLYRTLLGSAPGALAWFALPAGALVVA